MKPQTARAFALEEAKHATRRGLRLAKGAAAALRAAGVRVEELETAVHAVRREHAGPPWNAGPKVGLPRNVHPWTRATANRERPDLVMVPWRQAWADCLAVSVAALTAKLGLCAEARGALVRRLLDDPEFARAHAGALALGGPEAGASFLRAAVPPALLGRRRKR
jgi:hypothetical protein